MPEFETMHNAFIADTTTVKCIDCWWAKTFSDDDVDALTIDILDAAKRLHPACTPDPNPLCEVADNKKPDEEKHEYKNPHEGFITDHKPTFNQESK